MQNEYENANIKLEINLNVFVLSGSKMAEDESN